MTFYVVHEDLPGGRPWVKGARKQNNLRTTRVVYHLGAIVLSWLQRPQHSDVVEIVSVFSKKLARALGPDPRRYVIGLGNRRT